ncbi:glycine zipper 2TM domain-containing protein [Sphingomonas sp.]|uniref:glycine zipper 2TM domain-containing protein n=1 Tax=Sphingomonas sp. TaxID=28214 RepID=UPI001B09A878|nr:glycine zipper 2TM domain-containing protein [Sphingomonas sp.]MBO9711946.1 glycine zipper 2TM domain-containing protein [Sphingomonas sp.]
MKRFPALTAAALAAASALVAATPAAAQRGDYRYVAPEEQRFYDAQARFEREYEIFQQEFDRYRAWRAQNPGPRPGYPGPGGYQGPGGYNGGPGGYYDDRDEGSYDPSRYYRTGPQYQERVLGADDRVYRGRDGQYYCKRSDGTTGLIVGGATGAVLGNVIDGGHSRAVGTILGAAIGAVVGKSVEQNQNQVRCR